MIHCIIEYSTSIDSPLGPENLIEAVQQGATNSDLFKETDIKTRVIPVHHYRTGTETAYFVHVVLKILSGQTRVQRQLLSNMVMDSLSMLVSTGWSISVEIVEIEKESYSELVL
ncbi:5-carboxymethyl-2-hydroxymuconate Delta-isomerase [Exilibacterium tricleocarpae]|uniref:5-carboxymethyl-2-hydroxymuconate Delta-isomerase n=1 Tax=Exilibacterium tricleocarpae TaxID=2591008 RepID=A0A545TFS8_9GAMM|nr:5-carboxymethyl-2-hydroxymuconate Delta-isomerase [Exilibacterium tricleocarpae]TQV76055.1 5-carboxymethyl-2-hydroxymuconate Delta-isomerase [Exilibacterium tricleocarpae]